ncbi:hypothetical protein Ga0100231_017530 [Opitutaceae bacterium TAV4]|nr:hypothetical protein Ga0100231_017530 [Opitutaceae bacterium TAV4]
MPSPAREPWPMKWVFLAILLCIVPYTWIALRYRKPAPAAEPYADRVERTAPTTHRHLSLKAERPAPPNTEVPRDAFAIGRATLTPLPPGLPQGLLDILGSPPRLPASVNLINVPAEIQSGEPVAIQFTCHLAGEHDVLGGADIYIKENAIVILPAFESLDADLQARTLNERVRITIPPGTLKPGAYDVRLMAADNGYVWQWLVH